MKEIHLDSSFLIALEKVEDKHHESAVKHLFALDDPHQKICVSSVALTESLTGPYQHSVATGEMVLGEFKKILDDVVAIDEEIAILAAKRRAKSGMRAPDALIIAAAQKHSAELWTYDQRMAKSYKEARLLK